MSNSSEAGRSKTLPPPGQSGRPALFPSIPVPLLARYGSAIAAVALAALLTWLIAPAREQTPVAFFFGAVALCAWYGGLGPGLLATFLSALTAAYFFLPPLYTLLLPLNKAIPLSAFVLVALLITGLTEGLRWAKSLVQAQRQQLKTILNSIGEAVMVTGGEGHITFMNDMAESLTGWSLAEAGSKPLEEVYHLVDQQTRQRLESPVSRVMRGDRVANLADHPLLIARDGREISIEYNGVPIKDAGHRISGVVLTFRDVTARRRVEMAQEQLLRENRRQWELLERVVNNAPAAIAMLQGPEHRYMLANREYLKLARGKGRLISRTVAEVWPEIAGQIVPLLDHVYQTGEPYHANHMPLTIERKGAQEENFFTFTYILLEGTRGQPGTILVLAQETTEQAQARREIEEAYALLDTIFTSAPIGLAFWDRDLRFVRLNRALAEMNGLPLEAHIGKTPQEVLPKVARMKDITTAWQQILETGQPIIDFEVGGETPAAPGQERYWLESWYPVRVEQEVIGIGGVVQEITERKRAEEQLKASLREKEVLLREVHHRVKNNLQAVSNLLYMQSHYLQDESMRNVLQETQDRIKSIALIHEKLYQTQDLAQLNFAEYVRGLTTHLINSYQADPDSIHLKLEIEDVFVDLDTAVPLGIIINELVSNSLKYAFPAGFQRPCEILISLKQAGDRILLTVGDNGVGLADPLDIDQVPSMGLRLIDLLTRHMRGTIEVDQVHGMTYKISLTPLPPAPPP